MGSQQRLFYHIMSPFCDRLIEAGLKDNPAAERKEGQKGRVKQSVAYNFLKRFETYKDGVLRFLHNLAVPFDNNEGERAVRMPKVKLKVSGCFRTGDGALSFAVHRSYIDTMRKQGYGILESLTGLFTGYPITPSMA
ncbi:MAG: transposase [Magnetococcales bacterium]|nr:transposase [Magnetococcales bacterium]